MATRHNLVIRNVDELFPTELDRTRQAIELRGSLTSGALKVSAELSMDNSGEMARQHIEQEPRSRQRASRPGRITF